MTEVISSNESVVNRYRYTPFGQSIEKDESVYNPYQFTGRRYDEERGNYYYRARIYDQQQSRFLSNDPAGQGANLYAYVGNNPTNRRDPSGTVYIGGPGSPPPRLIDGSVGEMKNNECSNNDNYDTFGSCLNHASYEDCLETCYLVEFNPPDGGGGGGGGCEFTDEYWDCVDENTWGAIHITSIVLGCAGGCLMSGPGWPACVIGCLVGAGIGASSPYVGCLVREAYQCGG